MRDQLSVVSFQSSVVSCQVLAFSFDCADCKTSASQPSAFMVTPFARHAKRWNSQPPGLRMGERSVPRFRRIEMVHVPSVVSVSPGLRFEGVTSLFAYSSS